MHQATTIRTDLFHGVRRGVTLPEVLTVIAIVGILSAMAVPRFLRFTATSRLETAAQIMGKDVEWTKLAATKSGMKHYLRFIPGSDSSGYEIFMENSDPTNYRFGEDDDSLLKRVVLDPTVKFGIASSIPVAPGSPSLDLPADGLGLGFPNESCRDDSLVSGQGSWSRIVAFCGGSTADMEAGVAYLTSKNYPDLVEAIVYDDQSSFRLSRYSWRGSWTER